MKKYFLLLFIFLLFSCNTPIKHGYVFEESDVEGLKIGLTNQEEIVKILGYPQTKSYFDENTWYYYSYLSRKFLFFKPFISKEKLLIVEFEPETNILKNKLIYNLDTKKYEFKTNNNYEDDKSNIIKDIFNNIGQISM